ncbi:phage Gp37/Gp68 family protein [Amycolatopsis sp. DSM 110486]|nr:phage Gp37/Gp68 family protein [Amycolatopsis sp. DSM 110486]
MSATTTIEWTDATWDPVTGCTEVSEGCDHCYAKPFAERRRGTLGHYWVVAGGESGPGTQPLHPEWARSLRNQCDWATVRFLFKLLCANWGSSARMSDSDGDRVDGAGEVGVATGQLLQSPFSFVVSEERPNGIGVSVPRAHSEDVDVAVAGAVLGGEVAGGADGVDEFVDRGHGTAEPAGYAVERGLRPPGFGWRRPWGAAAGGVGEVAGLAEVAVLVPADGPGDDVVDSAACWLQDEIVVSLAEFVVRRVSVGDFGGLSLDLGLLGGGGAADLKPLVVAADLDHVDGLEEHVDARPVSAALAAQQQLAMAGGVVPPLERPVGAVELLAGGELVAAVEPGMCGHRADHPGHRRDQWGWAAPELVTERVYRHQIRPVMVEAETAMDGIVGRRVREP